MPNLDDLAIPAAGHSLEQAESIGQFANLQVSAQQNLDARIGAALAFVVESLLGQNLQDAKQAEQVEVFRDPASYRTASGLDATQTATLDDVTKTVSAEQALKQKTASENAGAFDTQTLSDPGRDMLRDQQVAGESARKIADAAQGINDPIGAFRAQLVSQAQQCVEDFQQQLSHNADSLKKLNDDQLQDLFRSLVQNPSVENQWQTIQQQAGPRANLDRTPVAGMIEQLRDVNAQVEQLRAQPPGAARNDALLDLVIQQKDLLFDTRLAMTQLKADVNLQGRLDTAWKATFSEVPVGDQGPYATAFRLAQGNLGERLATEALAADGHQILFYKPDILGTNQGGIDMVTRQDGMLYLIDNKALSRDVNVSSASALTTNFEQNVAALRDDFAAYAADATRPPAEVQLFQQAVADIDSGNYVRAVTNANISEQVARGITQTLEDKGIRSIDVRP
jgi:Holliday junction resolvase-like predicted endonuclease